MKSRRLLAIIFCSFLTLSTSLSGQEVQPNGTRDSCREFVREFYVWYLAKTSKYQGRGSDLALKFRPYLFSSELARQIREDSEAQDKAGSDLVSLDGDPFIGADGYGERYIVEKITIENEKCLAEVHAVWGRKEDDKPDVMPILVLKKGKWIFVDFYFPGPSSPNGWSLLEYLKELREEQKKTVRKR